MICFLSPMEKVRVDIQEGGEAGTGAMSAKPAWG